jgi:hypothetical protein
MFHTQQQEVMLHTHSSRRRCSTHTAAGGDAPGDAPHTVAGDGSWTGDAQREERRKGFRKMLEDVGNSEIKGARDQWR